MKIFTNENNTSTLKLIIAANLAGKKVELKGASLTDGIFTGPRQLPFLEVDDELSFFSSNAATQYLFPVLDLSENGQCQQMQEWEATRLHPAVQTVVTSKTINPELKQLLAALLQDIDKILATKQFILGSKLSAADISIWSTLYPLYYNTELKSQYLSQAHNITRWIEELALAKAVKEAITQWGGSAKGPFTVSCCLGIPHIPTLLASPETPEGPELGVTAAELEKAQEFWTEGLSKLQPYLKPEKVILPIKGKKNILITSALPYVNNVPHLGNIIGCVLSADIFARYCRACSYNTLFVCGTDEYGTATETKALEEGLSPQQICDKYHRIHDQVYRWFGIEFDYFGRTSTPEQTRITQQMFLKLKDNGFISTECVDQLLCEPCNRYLADRFVEGTCPHPACGYEDARGDQCDRCGKLVTATELKNPKCKACGAAPVIRNKEQQFLDLAQLSGMVQTWARSKEEGWSSAARAAARGWLRDGLRARCITRDLRWGVPVPLAGYEDKVFYVWFDAPIGYISITQCCTQHYERWWKPAKDEHVKLYQFMAKDNVPFHAVMFPAMLLGANEGHLMVDHLYATEYLNYEEGKFSKSRGVGVFGTDAQETGIPADVWRFYLASIRPEGADSSFSWTELGTRNNSELLNNLGNFCHRSLSFCANSFGGRVPDIRFAHADLELIALVNRELRGYVNNMEKGRLREALKHVLLISKLGNQYMQAQQPWLLLKGSDQDKARGASAVGLCCQLVAMLCVTLAPYMPHTAATLSRQLNLQQHQLRINPESPYMLRYLAAGHALGKPEPLFTKLEPAHLQQLRLRYAGTQLDRNNKESEVCGVAELEAALTRQAEKVRQVKASTRDKSVWQPEVQVLLDLKQRLQRAQSAPPPPPPPHTPTDTPQSLEKAISEQGDKVRKLKASTKDKAVWAPEVAALLDLKKRLAALQLGK